jgi:sortase A
MLRRRRQPADDSTIHLLDELLQAPVAESRLRPVALRSLDDQRREVLAPYPFKTWIDRALGLGERTLFVALLAFAGWWLADGYGRDWWYARTVAETAHESHAPAAVAPVSRPAPDVAHPEVGRSLPVVDERWSRPSVELDYLTPARVYVPPARDEPQPVAAIEPVDLRPTQLAIPAIGLESHVVEVFLQNGVWQVADYAVGYHHGTGVAGYGNMVMAGHAGLRGGVFRQLERLAPGDEIVVTSAGRQFRYRVRSAGSVWPSQVEVMYPTEQPQLTLMTCTNWDMQRWVVVADFEGAIPDAVAAHGSEG